MYQRQGGGDVTEYEVAVIVVSMLTTAIAIGAPVIKLNTAITKLIVRLDSLGEDLDDLEHHNHEAHRRLWAKAEEQDRKLDDHETRLKLIERMDDHV